MRGPCRFGISRKELFKDFVHLSKFAQVRQQYIELDQVPEIIRIVFANIWLGKFFPENLTVEMRLLTPEFAECSA